MTLQQITSGDITGWNTLSDIAASFEKRGLKVREKLGEDNELVLQLANREFIVLVEAGPRETASDFKPDNRRRRTNLVATNDYEEFTFLTRVRAIDGQQHGRIKHQKLSFTKGQMTSEGGEKNTLLRKLNSLEYGSAAAIYDGLYDTQQVVKEFYQQFETRRWPRRRIRMGRHLSRYVPSIKQRSYPGGGGCRVGQRPVGNRDSRTGRRTVHTTIRDHATYG